MKALIILVYRFGLVNGFFILVNIYSGNPAESIKNIFNGAETISIGLN
jgi:hypothetical protein